MYVLVCFGMFRYSSCGMSSKARSGIQVVVCSGIQVVVCSGIQVVVCSGMSSEARSVREVRHLHMYTAKFR